MGRTSNMKAFAILALLPLALAGPAHPAPSYGSYHQPAPYHPAPAYGHPAPAYGHHAGYGYEEPKHNCSVIDVTEIAEVCTPTIEVPCDDIALPIKVIEDIPYTYTVTRTVCTESIEVVPQEVCTYFYEQESADTVAKTVVVTFEKVTRVDMVTVCQPGHHGHGGYGHGGYGHNYCQEIATEKQYNVPVVTPVDIPVTVAYPAPKKVRVDKPISLPVVTCADISEEKTIQVPTVVDSEVVVAHCKAEIGVPACQKVELTLPKQVCVQLVYGYAHEPAPAPGYPAAPAPHA